MPSSRLIGVGVFVIGGLLIFALGLFMIGDRRFLFSDLFDLHAEFEQIAGLQDGAAVRVNGMDAGEVTDIDIPPSPAGRFRVRMRVRAKRCGPSFAPTPWRRSAPTASSAAATCTSKRDPSRRRWSPTAARSTAASRSISPTFSLRARETIANVNRTIAELRVHLDQVVGVIRETAAMPTRS